ncbi:glutathione S-transferase family protein [Myxococcota bacterium]|nr:glutathione S-transferase family protein [Myxococcota bacterium]
MSRKMPTGGLHTEIDLSYEQEWELYHNSFSLCSKKLRVCMVELGLAYRSHEIDLIETGSYQNVGREFLAVNPAGTVPVLVHRGHPVYESHEQIVYAAEHAGARGMGLLPSEPELREIVDDWTDRASLVGNPLESIDQRAGHCIPGLTLPLFATTVAAIPYVEIFKGLFTHPNKERPLIFAALKFFGVRGLPKLGPMMKIVARSRDHMARHLDALEDHLAKNGGPWMVGEIFTLADVSWVVVLDRLVEADWEEVFWGAGQRPHVAAYWQELAERSSYRTAVLDARCPNVRDGIAALAEAKAGDRALRAALEGELGTS